MKTDALFYRLFSRLPKTLFDLLGVEYVVPYQMISEEVKQTAFRLDGIFSPQLDDPMLPIYFVEVQFQPDDRFYSRLFGEVFVYLHKKQLDRPYQIVVIYPNRKVERVDQFDHYGSLLASDRVSRIYLDQMTSRFDESFELQLVSLVIANAKKPQELVERSREILVHRRDQIVLADLVDWIEIILTYQFPRMSREEIQKMLNTFDIDLKQTRFYQDVFGEGEQFGFQKGEQFGFQKGEQLGFQKGEHIGLERERQLIIRLLNRRLGSLSVSVVSKIDRLTLPQLELLGEGLLDFGNINDLERWLGQVGDDANTGT